MQRKPDIRDDSDPRLRGSPCGEGSTQSDEEKLVALWRNYQDLRARGVLPDSAYLKLHSDGSGEFASIEAPEHPESDYQEVAYSDFADFAGGVSSDRTYTEWKNLRSSRREVTVAGKLCEALNAWRRAKLVPEPTHIIVWGEGQNLTVWGDGREPFVFRGSPEVDLNVALVSLWAWAEG